METSATPFSIRKKGAKLFDRSLVQDALSGYRGMAFKRALFIRLNRVSSIALLLFVATAIQASPLLGNFYRVKVQLYDGRVLTGSTWGLGWMGGGIFQEHKIKEVRLQVEGEHVKATFRKLTDDSQKTFSVPLRDQYGKPYRLQLASKYQRYDLNGGPTLFWIQESVEIPLADIRSIETEKVIGTGQPMGDPRPYQNLREPFLQVRDCARGYDAKLFSAKAGLSTADLERLWTERLACELDVSETQRDHVMKQNQLELLPDPFCVD